MYSALFLLGLVLSAVMLALIVDACIQRDRFMFIIGTIGLVASATTMISTYGVPNP